MTQSLFYAKIFPMDNTIELYYESAYIKDFDASVLSCEKRADGSFDIVLDRTAFFPEQGGQSSDCGVLEVSGGTAVHVTHASIKGGIITHRADGALEAGTTVHGVIDWEHRFSNMQQHTGEHIFSGIVS